MKSYMIPVLPKPVIPTEPRAPVLVEQLPPSIVTTAEEVSYWDEACESWQGGEYTDAEMAEEYPGLSMAASCEWAIYGHSVQGHLNLESIFVRQATYAEQMRGYVQTLIQIIESQYDLSQNTQDAIKEANDREPPPPRKKFLGMF